MNYGFARALQKLCDGVFPMETSTDFKLLLITPGPLIGNRDFSVFSIINMISSKHINKNR